MYAKLRPMGSIKRDVVQSDESTQNWRAVLFSLKARGLSTPKRATEWLIKVQDEWLSFDNIPAQHWQSIRTSNPIENACATFRHRTKIKLLHEARLGPRFDNSFSGLSAI